MPDNITSKTRTEKVTKSIMESTPYMMVEPDVARALCAAQLVFAMVEDGKTIYPAYEGVTLEDVRAFIVRKRSEPVAPVTKEAPIEIDGMAPLGPENHPALCKPGDMKVRKRKLVLVVETECRVHGIKTNVTTLPDDLATVGLVAIAEAARARRGGGELFPDRTPGGNHNLN